MVLPPDLARKMRAHQGLPPPAMRRAIRQAAGLSQQDIASELGVDRASVSHYETGDRQPRGELLMRYAELLAGLKEAIG